MMYCVGLMQRGCWGDQEQRGEVRKVSLEYFVCGKPREKPCVCADQGTENG